MHMKELIRTRNLLTFENHPASILSMSSVLLLCQRPNDLVLDGFLNGSSYTVLEDRLSHLNWGVSEFPSALLDVLKKATVN
ncbi:hypothetical protein BCV72DRAFT_80587 [Rhizopus microsporus var. microsporus]|uniref:Uncharacterized protein n=1 Tax=Rhizopus microsporus var. microsporus TaxID=86635 RepID=A0A1X0QNC8_RHIZD|nr:hypothetical protein BCV72DRAFT_80587 [Rhizopus microsporus var. microsporus]